MILIYTQIHIQYTRRLITTFIWKFIHIPAQSQNCNINIHTKYTLNTIVDLLQYLFGNLFIYLDRVKIVFSNKISLETAHYIHIYFTSKQNIKQQKNIKM